MGRRTLLLIASILVAALGTALVWLYVQGADTRAQAGEVEVQVYVASRTVPAGQPATAVQAVPKRLPQSIVRAYGSNLVTDPSQVAGYTRTDVVAGAPLLTGQFSSKPVAPAASVDLRSGELAMMVSLPDPQRLAGLLQPGTNIRVFTPTKKGVGVLFDKVRVLTAGPTTTSGKGQVPQALVTLAVTNDQAKELVLALSQAQGSLWFGLLGPAVPDDTGNLVKDFSHGGTP